MYSSAGPDMAELCRVRTVEEAAAVTAEAVAAHVGPLRVGVGDADADDAAVALRGELAALPQVVETIR